MGRALEMLEAPIGRFVIEETSEGAKVFALLGGSAGARGPTAAELIRMLKSNPAAMEKVASVLESRLSRIEAKFRKSRMHGNDELYSQLALRRIVREELTVASSSTGLKDRFFGRHEIEFVAYEPTGFAEAEEIFLDAAKNEVLRPDEIMENLAINTESLSLMLTHFDPSSTYALEMWTAKAITTFSEATSYLKKALPVAKWEAELGQSEMPLARVRRTVQELQGTQKEIARIFASLERAHSPVMTRGMKQAFTETSAELDDVLSALARKKL
jgi:hypothetical protein